MQLILWCCATPLARSDTLHSHTTTVKCILADHQVQHNTLYQSSCSNGAKILQTAGLCSNPRCGSSHLNSSWKLVFTPTNYLVHNRNRDQTVQFGERHCCKKASFWCNKMWTRANERVHNSGSSPYSEPSTYRHGRRTVSSCDVFSITSAVWASNRNLVFFIEFTNDWEIWNNKDKIRFPVSQISRSNFQPQTILEPVVCTRQWGTKRATHDRTLNANSEVSNFFLPISFNQMKLLHKPNQHKFKTSFAVSKSTRHQAQTVFEIGPWSIFH